MSKIFSVKPREKRAGYELGEKVRELYLDAGAIAISDVPINEVNFSKLPQTHVKKAYKTIQFLRYHLGLPNNSDTQDYSY